MIHQMMMSVMKNHMVTIMERDLDQVLIIIMIQIMIRGQWGRIINIIVVLPGQAEAQVQVVPELKAKDRL